MPVPEIGEPGHKGCAELQIVTRDTDPDLLPERSAPPGSTGGAGCRARLHRPGCAELSGRALMADHHDQFHLGLDLVILPGDAIRDSEFRPQCRCWPSERPETFIVVGLGHDH